MRKPPLRFAKLPCVRCGADRILERACPECGEAPRPGETNEPVVLRRQACHLIQAGEEALSGHPDENLAAEANDVLEDLAQWATTMAASISELIRSPGPASAAKMGDTLRVLRRFESRAFANQSVRPVGLGRATAAVTRELSRLWPLYAEALTTSDMQRAQQLSDIGQQVLDNAPSALEEARLVERAAAQLRNEDGVPSLIERVMMALHVRYCGLEFEQYSTLGRSRAEATATVAVADAYATEYLVEELVADAYLDVEQFRAKVRECSVRFGESTSVETLAGEPAALGDLAAARRQVFEAAKHCMHVLDVETDPEAAFRRYSRTVGEIYEAAGPLWAWARVLVAGSPEAPSYAKAASDDATANVVKVARALPKTAADAPSYLRNAASHNGAISIAVPSELVTISLRSYEETLPVTEYVGRVLALVESVLALSWSIGNALGTRGLDIPLGKADASYFGLAGEQMARFWLERSKGFAVESSVISAGIWTIVAAVPAEEVFSTAIVIATQTGGEVAEVRLRSTGSAGAAMELTLRDWLQFGTAYDAAVNHLRPILTAEMLQMMRLEGRPVLRHEELAAALISAALPILRGDTVDAAGLRRVKNLADKCGWSDLSELAVGAIRVIRSGESEPVIRDLRALAVASKPDPRIVTTAVTVRTAPGTLSV